MDNRAHHRLTPRLTHNLATHLNDQPTTQPTGPPRTCPSHHVCTNLLGNGIMTRNGNGCHLTAAAAQTNKLSQQKRNRPHDAQSNK